MGVLDLFLEQLMDIWKHVTGGRIIIEISMTNLHYVWNQYCSCSQTGMISFDRTGDNVLETNGGYHRGLVTSVLIYLQDLQDMTIEHRR